jgi:hypothetical protein
LGGLPERFMGKQIVVCYLPWTSYGTQTAVPLLSSCLQAGRSYTADRSPERDPYGIFRASVSRRGPSRRPLFPSHKPTRLPNGRPLRPEDRLPVHLTETSHVGPNAPLSVPEGDHHLPLSNNSCTTSIACSHFRGAVCSSSSKAGDPSATHPCPHPMSGEDKPPSEPHDLPIKYATTPRGGLGGVSTHDLGKPPATV